MNEINSRMGKILLFTMVLVVLLSGCKFKSSTTNSTTNSTATTTIPTSTTATSTPAFHLLSIPARIPSVFRVSECILVRPRFLPGGTGWTGTTECHRSIFNDQVKSIRIFCYFTTAELAG